MHVLTYTPHDIPLFHEDEAVVVPAEECSDIFHELSTDALPLTAMIFPDRKGCTCFT